MNEAQQIEEIELSIEEAKEHIELGRCLDRLQTNTDFTRLINEEYLKEEAIRVVHLRTDPQMQTPERQLALDKQMDAIGGLLNFFRAVQYRADQSIRAIEDSEEVLEELRLEEVSA